MCSCRLEKMHSEMLNTFLSLCTSYSYLCRRLSNTDFVWQLSIQGLGSNWSTNRKWKKEIVEKKERNKKRQISSSPSPWSPKSDAKHGARFCRGRISCGSPERFVFVETRCQKRQDFLRAQHNMSPSLIISHSQTWSALNALMLKEPRRLEASSRWNHSTHPWQTAIHHTRIKQSLHIKSPPKRRNNICP